MTSNLQEVKFRIKDKTTESAAVRFSVEDSISKAHGKLIEFLDSINWGAPDRTAIYVSEVNGKANTLTIAASWNSYEKKWFISGKLSFWIIWSTNTFIVMNEKEFRDNWKTETVD